MPDGMTPDQMAQYQDMQGDEGENEDEIINEQQEQLQNQLGQFMAQQDDNGEDDDQDQM